MIDDVMTPAAAGLDIERIRRDFPALHQEVYGKPLVYLDNAATTLKPQVVIDTMMRYYALENSNIHRGVHYLSQKATQAYEDARERVRRFINARETKEIIVVRGTTEGINLVARSFGHSFAEGDEIVLSAMEHHSNIVPWQLLCEQTGAVLRVVPINDDGEIMMDEYERMLNDRTRIVAMGHVSNALGTINPARRIVELAHERGVPVLFDGAQAVPHIRVDVQELDCDFYVFSSHKLYGPTGVGILYGRRELLEKMPPYQGGGDMIASVTFEKTTYNQLPYKFEAGTPHISGLIGLAAAIDYVESIGIEKIVAYEHELLEYATERLSAIPGLRIIGTAREKASVEAFVLDGVHPHDIGTILDREGVAIRAGHHCAMPVMQRFDVPATARASFAFYNTREEIDRLDAAIRKVQEVFG